MPLAHQLERQCGRARRLSFALGDQRVRRGPQYETLSLSSPLASPFATPEPSPIRPGLAGEA